MVLQDEGTNAEEGEGGQGEAEEAMPNLLSPEELAKPLMAVEKVQGVQGTGVGASPLPCSGRNGTGIKILTIHPPFFSLQHTDSVLLARKQV